MVLTLSRIWIYRVWLPILLVVRSTGNTLHREQIFLPVSPFAPDIVFLANWVRPSRPASAHSFSTPRLNLMLITHGFISSLPFFATTFIHTVHRCRTSLELPGRVLVHRWHSLPRDRRHRPPSSNGYCLFRCHHRPICARPSFLTPIGRDCTVAQIPLATYYRRQKMVATKSLGKVRGGGGRDLNERTNKSGARINTRLDEGQRHTAGSRQKRDMAFFIFCTHISALGTYRHRVCFFFSRGGGWGEEKA